MPRERNPFADLRACARIGGLLALLHDPSTGTMTGGSAGRPRIQYHLTEGDHRQLTRGRVHVVEVLWAPPKPGPSE